MKNVKETKAPAGGDRRWLPWLAAAAVALAALRAYWPALEGGFVFDDRYLPLLSPGAMDWPWQFWFGRTRPVLMFSFWLHMHLLGLEPFSYHVVNLVLHLANSALVFLIVRRVMERAAPDEGRIGLLSSFGAALFLLHPLQTESVSYVASRSEVLSAAFFLGALAIFLFRRGEAVSLFPAGVTALALFAAAVLSKEHTAVLPALFLLADYYWYPGFSFVGIRKNWRLYAPILLLGAGGFAFVWQVLRISATAGFRIRGMAWQEYLFTQGRVIWTYVRMFVLPFGQNIDPDVPISHGLLDHGAAFGLAALAALAAAAWIWRKREPLASFGVFVFLLLLAPTSSIVPIRDPLAERRMYLPILGLILVTLALLRRWRAGHSTVTGGLIAVVALAGIATYQRNQVWAGSIPLWEDAAAKSPAKARPRFQLAFAYYESGRCAEAAREFDVASRLDKPNYDLLLDWGLALECSGRYDDAVDRLQRAAKLESSAHVYATLGMVHGKHGNREAAMEALARAESLDASYDMTYAYRGNLFLMANDFERAAAEFRRALGINPSNPVAAQGLRAMR